MRRNAPRPNAYVMGGRGKRELVCPSHKHTCAGGHIRPYETCRQAVERAEAAVRELRERMFDFYRTYNLTCDSRISQLGNLTVKMCGPDHAPKLNCKGAECRHVLPWLRQLLLEFSEPLAARGRGPYREQRGWGLSRCCAMQV